MGISFLLFMSAHFGFMAVGPCKDDCPGVCGALGPFPSELCSPKLAKSVLRLVFRLQQVDVYEL